MSALHAEQLPGRPVIGFGCLHQALPGRVPAEGTACLWTLNMRGVPRGANDPRERYAVSAVTNGGTGARPHADGLSATAFPSGVKGTPVEIVESQAPLTVWRKELRTDSGGAGRSRGGLGQVIELESASGNDFEILAAFDRIAHPARGRDGGGSGAPGMLSLDDGTVLRGKGFQTVPAGRRLRVLTPGGGGIGDPGTRERAALQDDIEDEVVSPAQAAGIYAPDG